MCRDDKTGRERECWKDLAGGKNILKTLEGRVEKNGRGPCGGEERSRGVTSQFFADPSFLILGAERGPGRINQAEKRCRGETGGRGRLIGLRVSGGRNKS